jgi:hypothetical protein
MQHESATSEIGRFEPGMLRDAGEHFGPDLNAIVKGPDVFGERGVAVPEFNVRAGLGNGISDDPQERLLYRGDGSR